MRLFLIMLLLTACSSQKKNNNNYDYENNLLITLKEGNISSISNREIIQLFPSSQKEYYSFYSMTYPNRSKEIIENFYLLDSKMSTLSSTNDNIFEEYLLMSAFVDGEYAESYFSNIEFLITENSNRFCKIIKPYMSNLDRLSDFTSKFCNSSEHEENNLVIPK